jgi:hypothetical protein
MNTLKIYIYSVVVFSLSMEVGYFFELGLNFNQFFGAPDVINTISIGAPYALILYSALYFINKIIKGALVRQRIAYLRGLVVNRDFNPWMYHIVVTGVPILTSITLIVILIFYPPRIMYSFLYIVIISFLLKNAAESLQEIAVDGESPSVQHVIPTLFSILIAGYISGIVMAHLYQGVECVVKTKTAIHEGHLLRGIAGGAMIKVDKDIIYIPSISILQIKCKTRNSVDQSFLEYISNEVNSTKTPPP